MGSGELIFRFPDFHVVKHSVQLSETRFCSVDWSKFCSHVPYYTIPNIHMELITGWAMEHGTPKYISKGDV